ncbi:MAG: PAS domain S-box protein, partial [Flavisolibacter sp.]
MDLKVNTEKNLLNNTERGLNFPGKVAGETIINGFFSVDQKWNVRYWNKAAEKLLGIKSEDILNKNIWEEFAGVLPLEFYNVYHKAFSQRLPVHFEEYWGEMGTWFDVITYHSEEALHVSFKTCQPKKIERPAQQLAILNELYRLITEVTNDCLWEWDLQLEEIFWIDGGHKRVFGYDIENALIPESFWVGQIHPEDRARVMGKLKKSFVSPDDKMWEDEYRFQKSNGEYAYVHDRGHIVYNEEKKACRIIGATQDISLRKLAEMQLFESEKKLALIAKQTSNALIITDADYKIIWVNNAFVLMSGYKSSEVIGRQMGSFMLGKETLADTLIYLRKKIRDKEPFDCDILNYTKSGNKIWLRIQGQPLLDENGVCFQYFLIETDITERIDMENKLVKERVEREVEITNAVLNAQENERASIGRDLHDNLNQILGAAKMYVELAKTDSVNREVCLEKSSGYIMEVIKEIRHICKNWAAPNQNFISFFDSV